MITPPAQARTCSTHSFVSHVESRAGRRGGGGQQGSMIRQQAAHVETQHDGPIVNMCCGLNAPSALASCSDNAACCSLQLAHKPLLLTQPRAVGAHK